MSIMPHFYAPGLRLFARPLTWKEWQAVMPVRIDASLSSSPAKHRWTLPRQIPRQTLLRVCVTFLSGIRLA